MFQDVQFAQEREEPIQQTGFIQRMHRVDLLPLIDSLSHAGVIPFREAPVQILSQVVADIRRGLCVLCHGSPHTRKIPLLYHKLADIIRMLMCYPAPLAQVTIP